MSDLLARLAKLEQLVRDLQRRLAGAEQRLGQAQQDAGRIRNTFGGG